MAPFPFLLVDKGLSGLFSRVMELHVFYRLRVGASDFTVSHMQYANYAIILVEAFIDNIWGITEILQGFELTSGIRVNFAKSYLISLNCDHAFLDLSCDFFHCKT